MFLVYSMAILGVFCAPEYKTKPIGGTQIAYKYRVDRLATCNAELMRMMDVPLAGQVRTDYGTNAQFLNKPVQFHPDFNKKLKECSVLLEDSLPEIHTK